MGKQLIALLGFVAVLLAACGGPRIDSSAAPLDGAWVLESGTLDGEPIPLVEGYRITFTAAGAGFSGTAACNQYSGLFAVEAWELTLRDMSMTEMACEPDVMASEAAYVFAIRRINLAAHEGDQLVLTGPGAELRFDPLPPVPDEALVGTTWILDGLISGDSVSTVRGDTLTLEFDPDGTFFAGTGCRTLSGRYVITGDEVHITDSAAEGECPADLQAQDAQVVGVLERFIAATDGNRLTLTAAGGEGLLYRTG
jgi:heat shock protein HslJ